MIVSSIVSSTVSRCERDTTGADNAVRFTPSVLARLDREMVAEVLLGESPQHQAPATHQSPPTCERVAFPPRLAHLYSTEGGAYECGHEVIIAADFVTGLIAKSNIVRKSMTVSSSLRECEMANNPRSISEAMNETLDVKLQAAKLWNLINRVTEDGQVTLEEAAAVRDQARTILNEADEAFEATREADIGQRLAVSYLTRTPINPTLRREAREVDYPLLIMTGNSTEQAGIDAA